MKRQVIATSFSVDRHIFTNIRNYIKYVNSVANVRKVCFISITDNIFEKLFFRITTPWQVDTFTKHDIINCKSVNEYDLVFVGGGNTYNLINLFIGSGFDDVLKDAYNRGVIMGGVSAGLLCWFNHGITDSFNNLTVINCLGFLPFSTTPHYEQRKEMYDRLVADGELLPGIGVSDGSIIHYINEQLF